MKFNETIQKSKVDPREENKVPEEAKVADPEVLLE